MPEQKDVKFDTIVTGDFTCYDADSDSIKLKVEVIPESTTSQTVRSICNINSSNKTINNVMVEENELCIVMRNQLKDYVDFEINDIGELIVHGKNANKYSINEDGELIYTEIQ